MGPGQKGPGKTIFSAKIIGKTEKQPNICEKSYKICAKSKNRAAPLGRRRRWRLLLLAHILYYFSHMFGCFSIFAMVFAENIVFQGPFCPGPFSRLPTPFYGHEKYPYPPPRGGLRPPRTPPEPRAQGQGPPKNNNQKIKLKSSKNKNPKFKNIIKWVPVHRKSISPSSICMD